jgi:hypothetical protein
MLSLAPWGSTYLGKSTMGSIAIDKKLESQTLLAPFTTFDGSMGGLRRKFRRNFEPEAGVRKRTPITS